MGLLTFFDLSGSHPLFLLGGSILLGGIQLVERRRSATPLHPSRQIALSTMLESMPEAVFVFGKDSRLQQANRAAEELLGKNKEAMFHLTAEGLAPYVMDQRTGTAPNPEELAVVRALRGEAVQQERRTLCVSRGKIEALVSANPIREQNGDIIGALVIVRDVTELSEMQQHIDEAERTGAIGRMAASMAHDFNNVLDNISKAAYILEVSPDRPEEERKVVLRMIQNAVKRGAEIVANVRQYIAGNRTSSDQIDLNCVLEEAIELTRPMWQGGTRQISLERQFQPVPKVRANMAEIRRVFTNLIVNALDAMPKGGVLRVGCEREANTVKAFVEDTGEGIPPEVQSRIFRPYSTTKKHGTGLGLASAYRYLRGQGGRITFSTKVGQGTRFVVELPASEESRRIA